MEQSALAVFDDTDVLIVRMTIRLLVGVTVDEVSLISIMEPSQKVQ